MSGCSGLRRPLNNLSTLLVIAAADLNIKSVDNNVPVFKTKPAGFPLDGTTSSATFASGSHTDGGLTVGDGNPATAGGLAQHKTYKPYERYPTNQVANKACISILRRSTVKGHV